MNNSTRKKQERLGMNPGTASSILKKSLLFSMAIKLGDDVCYRCGKKIITIEEFSIEHKISWLNSDNPKELFFDLDNIAFSHLSCNLKAKKTGSGVKHPSHNAYVAGCRCDECKEIEKLKARKYRAKKTILPSGRIG